ncbi:uncharacterized protein LOC121079834 [Cygnus olor]|uniref:uncharacterized protein LOC121079834 n=1 Tax=Cygnus olor TaxID=8869 RepID=UPI001ADE177B|nr:uncharacterized protein LOC121079834 [Cygnus olor]
MVGRGGGGGCGGRSLHGDVLLGDPLWKAPAQRSRAAATSVRSPPVPKPGHRLDTRNLIKNRARDSPLRSLRGGAARQDKGTLHGARVAGDDSTASPGALPQLLPIRADRARGSRGTGSCDRCQHEDPQSCPAPELPGPAQPPGESPAATGTQPRRWRWRCLRTRVCPRAALLPGAGAPFLLLLRLVQGNGEGMGRMRAVPLPEHNRGGGRGRARSWLSSPGGHNGQSQKGPPPSPPTLPRPSVCWQSPGAFYKCPAPLLPCPGGTLALHRVYLGEMPGFWTSLEPRGEQGSAHPSRGRTGMAAQARVPCVRLQQSRC